MSEPASPLEDGPEAVLWRRLTDDAAEIGVFLSGKQVESLRQYLALLCEWNQRFNLTAIEQPEEILLKHFLDSLTCALACNFTA